MDKKKPFVASGLFDTMTDTHKDRDDLLASEYAMGVLEGAEKEAAEARFETDQVFRAQVEGWQVRLSPMLEDVKEAVPSPQVWSQIASRTGQVAERESGGIWSSLAFWRGFSLVSGGLATAAIAVLLQVNGPFFGDPATNSQPLVAGLTATGTAPAFLARFDPKTGGLTVQVSVKDAKETRVAELWLIPGDGVPRSLGLLGAAGNAALAVSDKNRRLFSRGGTLAVSLEPAGGSPTGAPTGPVIASGKLLLL